MPIEPPPLQLDVDAHGRVTPRDEPTKRALADRAGRFVLLPSATDLLVARRSPVAGDGVGPPRCVLAGDLAGFPIVDFVAFVHQSRITGVLTVASDGAERSINFRDGDVRSASSSVPGERLEEVAVRLGFATEAQVARVGSNGHPAGRALVEAGLLTPNDLWKCVHEQVAAVFHEMLLARRGVFFLVDADRPEASAPALAVNTQTLLMDGIRRLDEMSLFRARLPSPAVVLRRREPRRQVPLNAAEQQLLALVDGRRSIVALAAAAHLNEFDATKILFHLAEAGHVEASPASGASDASLEAETELMEELLRRVAGAVPAPARPSFLEAVRTFLADPRGRHEPLWHGLPIADDGAIDRTAFLDRLASLPAPVVQRLKPSGDRRVLAREALRDLLFFSLFALGDRLPREEDDRLAAVIRGRLATLGGAE